MGLRRRHLEGQPGGVARETPPDRRSHDPHRGRRGTWAPAPVRPLVWLGFGAVAVPIVVDRANWITVVYAVLSLTVVRMMPVALALIGAGLDRETVLFIGWFGPRGLARLLFALLALEELGPAADQAVAVSAVTVFLSVLARGERGTARRSLRPGGRPRSGARRPDAGPAGARATTPPQRGPGIGCVSTVRLRQPQFSGLLTGRLGAHAGARPHRAGALCPGGY